MTPSDRPPLPAARAPVAGHLRRRADTPAGADPRALARLVLALCVLTPGALPVTGCGGPSPLPPLARALNGEGASLLAAGDLDRAEARFRLALEHHGGFAEARANLGLVALARGRLDEAARALEDAVRLAPDLAEAWNDLGIVHERRGALGDARRAYERALGIDPAFVAPRRNLVGLLVRRRAWREARAHLLRLDALAPGDASLGTLRAHCEARLRRSSTPR